MSEYLTKLRALLAQKSGELDAIIKAAETEGRALTKEEDEKVKALEADYERIETSVATEEKAIQRRAAQAEPASTPLDDNGQRRTPAEPKVKLTGIDKIGLIAMAKAVSMFEMKDFNLVNPLKTLDDHGYGEFAKSIEVNQKRKAEYLKTLNASTAVSAGILTPDNMASDIIELLYPETTFLQGKPRRVNLVNGVYSQPAGATGSTASYRQEGGALSTTEPTFREVRMSVKFLGAIVPMTRQSIDFTIAGTRAFVEQDLRESMSQTMDAKAYYGEGEEGEPQGIFSHTDITLVDTPAASPTLAQIDAFFSGMRLAMFNVNIRNMGSWRYVMSPRTLEYLQTRRVGDGSDGEFAYPETRGANPMIGSIPILSSTQFPINLGDGANETDIALVNFADVLLGMDGEVTIGQSTEATININGTWVSAYQNDLVFLRVMSGHDIGLRRPQSVVLARGVTWGAS